MRIGAHVSAARGPWTTVENARRRECDAIQIFSSNPRGWALAKGAPDSDRDLTAALDQAGIGPVLLHTPYLVNIASPDADIYAKSVACLVHAADRARRMHGHVIVHAGRDARQEVSREVRVQRAAAAVLTVLKLVPDASVLIEPTAGGRGSVASTLEETAELLECMDDERPGLCVDTCHMHAAGHDLSSAPGVRDWLAQADSLFGLHRVIAIHANDSKDARGSCRDRHWHLGLGEIGETGLRTLLSAPQLSDRTVICETPGAPEDDLANVRRAREYSRTDPEGRRSRAST
ncbi:MAG TPA: deoxyribonuclease IV [Actinomycetota bacterium]|nr:deoxyribonuclease IV [Actinomycetota bacterium]